MEIVISIAFGLWIAVTALAYRALCSEPKRGDKEK